MRTTAMRRSTANRETRIAAAGMQSSGQAIDATARMHLEPAFGHDFSRVRVYAHEASADAAASLDAAAYTVGSDIAFSAGRYQPDTPAGLALLAHELTHVVQNDRFGAAAGGAGASVETDGAEHEAMAAAGAAVRGRAVPQPVAPAAAVSLLEEELWNAITDNTLSATVGYATEASKDASSWFSGAAGEASRLPWLGRALGPLGIISNAMSMGQALDGERNLQGGADFTAAGMGLMGSIAPTVELMSAGAGALGLGTTAAAGGVGTGIAGGLGTAAAALGPVSALSASAAGGYALGSKAVGASDEISVEQGYFHDDQGRAQSGTSEAADWGMTVNDYIDGTWMGDTVGDVAGFATAGLSGIATTGYTLGRRGVEKVGDAAGAVRDFASENWTTDPDEIDWGRTFNPFRW
jgi:hypothetical protein